MFNQTELIVTITFLTYINRAMYIIYCLDKWNIFKFHSLIGLKNIPTSLKIHLHTFNTYIKYINIKLVSYLNQWSRCGNADDGQLAKNTKIYSISKTAIPTKNTFKLQSQKFTLSFSNEITLAEQSCGQGHFHSVLFLLLYIQKASYQRTSTSRRVITWARTR